MKKPKTFVLLSVLAAGSLLFGMESYALSEDAAEESRARGSALDVAGRYPEQAYTPTAGELSGSSARMSRAHKRKAAH